MKNVFVNVKLSKIDLLGFRIGGAGLGNILFPWARGVVFAKKNKLKKINSTWITFKFGTYLRKEKDKRNYHNIFLEKNIGGIRKMMYLFIGKHFSENEIIGNKIESTFRPSIITFFGMKNQMNDIINDQKIVKEELFKILRDKHLKLAEKHTPKSIAIHIRLGDFSIPNNEKDIRNGKTNCRLPLNWYVEIISNIRKELSDDIDVLVFSDGKDEELKQILDLPNVSRAKGGTAISDMLSLSYAKILIASNSTFSLWASYLGQNSTIWFPGTHRVKLFNNDNVFEGELDYNDNIPYVLIENLKNKN
ncbi:MAG: alpha-1,2-fucosyltransferase [Polaribacter sp.]|uniref:alpha-1,2-fucosyltransferase n=1 Tax=Polaribacter sp. TaxID=1920175 RepID=UPI0032671EE0